MKTKTELKIYVDREVVEVIKQHQEELVSQAQELYPDTEACDNEDLRTAFITGAGYGIWAALVLDAPQSLDRLQKDAFIAGVIAGETIWREEQYRKEDLAKKG